MMPVNRSIAQSVVAFALGALPTNMPGVRIGDTTAFEPLLATCRVIGAIGAAVLGAAARPVRAILFDKTEERNWALGWHQDRTIYPPPIVHASLAADPPRRRRVLQIGYLADAAAGPPAWRGV